MVVVYYGYNLPPWAEPGDYFLGHIKRCHSAGEIHDLKFLVNFPV